MIEIEIRDILLISEQDLIDMEELTPNSTDLEIEQGVHDYVLGMDDADYFYAKKHEEEICEKIKIFLKNT